MYVLYAFLNGCTDFDDIFRVCLSGSLDDLDSQLDPAGVLRRGAKTSILRCTVEIFVYKWLLFVGMKVEICILFVYCPNLDQGYYNATIITFKRKTHRMK